MSSPTANRRGILLMIGAMTLFTFSDAILKLAAATLPPGQIMALRGVLAVSISLGVIAATGQLRALSGIFSRAVVKRAVLEAMVSFLFITALAVLPLANITAIVQATPIIMTLMAVVLGLERVGWRRWSATLVGFVGVLLIVKPSASGFDVYALAAVVCALLIAWRDLVTRSIAAHVPSVVVTFSTTFAVMLAGFLIAAVEEWQPVGLYETGLLLAAAALVTIGNLGVIMAFRDTDVSVVAPFRYSNVPLAILLGAVIFGDLPDWLSFLGIALIVASGIYTIHRQRTRRVSPQADTALRTAEHPAEVALATTPVSEELRRPPGGD